MQQSVGRTSSPSDRHVFAYWEQAAPKALSAYLWVDVATHLSADAGVTWISTPSRHPHAQPSAETGLYAQMTALGVALGVDVQQLVNAASRNPAFHNPKVIARANVLSEDEIKSLLDFDGLIENE